jgi:hypothetical protein
MEVLMTAVLVEVEQANAPPVPHFRLLKSETLTLGKNEALQQAQAHAALPHSACERNLDAKHVRELVERISAGLWLPCCWATVDYQGVKYRMNGQHSSNAMIEAANCLAERVVIHLDHFEADDALGMGLLLAATAPRNSCWTHHFILS